MTFESNHAIVIATLSDCLKNLTLVFETLERFSIAFTANVKRQAEISRLPKTREIYLVSAYILPVSHSCGASTKNREISKNKIIFLLLRQAAACRLPFDVGRRREAKQNQSHLIRAILPTLFTRICQEF